MQRHGLAVLGVLIVLTFGVAARAEDGNFADWLSRFKAEARTHNISPSLIDAAFEGIEPDETVVKLDRKQPENKITLQKYLSNTVTKRRINRGRELLVEHAEVLKKISDQYGVQPKYIVALWGIESDYGSLQGDFSVVRSLATLAYEGRRAEFFGKELMAALIIMEREGIAPEDLSGSWAGAMGGCQFMPSTYQRFGADGDGDGKRDIWNTPADIFASTANYLHSLGWNDKVEWGKKAVFPERFGLSDASIKQAHTAKHWHKRGLKYADGSTPQGSAMLYAIYSGADKDTTYLVSENFKALLNWNRSRYFATAVGTLADAIGD